MTEFKELLEYSQINKNKDVKGENIFRHLLMAYKIKYQRQVIIGRFIVDFLLGDRNLIIEIDGEYHCNKKEYDEYRENWLKKKGFQILRFTDNQVINNSKFCIEQVLHSPSSFKKYYKIKNKIKLLNNLNLKKYKSEHKKIIKNIDFNCKDEYLGLTKEEYESYKEMIDLDYT